MAINLAVTLQGPARQGWVYEIQYMGYIGHAESPVRMEEMSLQEREQFIVSLLTKVFNYHRDQGMNRRPGDRAPGVVETQDEYDYDYYPDWEDDDEYDVDSDYLLELEERLEDTEAMVEKLVDFIGINNIDPNILPE